MDPSLHTRLRGTNPRTLWLLGAACVACIGLFRWRSLLLGIGDKVLDARFGYTPLDVVAFFGGLDPGALRLYAWSELTLDVLFPVAYVLFLAIGLSKLYSGAWAARMVLLPMLGGAADLLENGLLAAMAFTFDGGVSSLSPAASLITSVKFVLLSLALLLLVGGLIAGGITRIRRATGKEA